MNAQLRRIIFPAGLLLLSFIFVKPAFAGCFLGFLPPCTLDTEVGGGPPCEETCEVSSATVNSVSAVTREYSLLGRCYFKGGPVHACPPADAVDSWIFNADWESDSRSAAELAYRTNWDGTTSSFNDTQVACDEDPWINATAECNEPKRPVSAFVMSATQKTQLCDEVSALLVPRILIPKSGDLIDGDTLFHIHVAIPNCSKITQPEVVLELSSPAWPGSPNQKHISEQITVNANYALKVASLAPGEWLLRARLKGTESGIWSESIVFRVKSQKTYKKLYKKPYNVKPVLKIEPQTE